MKKYYFILIFTICLFPFISHASWWNPFSWFDNLDNNMNTWDKTGAVDYHSTDTKPISSAPTQVSVPTTDKKTPSPSPELDINTIFYVNSHNARVRECPDINCKILGYYQTNNELTFSGGNKLTLKDLDEWVKITPRDGSKEGYLNKTLLSETPIKISELPKDAIKLSNITSSDVEVTNFWIRFINDQKDTSQALERSLNTQGISKIAPEAITIIDDYVNNLDVLKNDLGNATNNDDKNLTLSIIKKIQDVSYKYADSIQTLVSEIKERQNNQYRNSSPVVNYQAQNDSINAQIQQYNEIIQNAKREGVTQGVVNNQLEAAGLIKQTHCSFSSVGGMTPGSGSVTCY